MNRKLDDWFTSYLQYTDDSEPPLIYHKWTAISVVAAVLQRKCWLIWDEQTFPNMYIALVGPSGCRKGTAMRFGRNLMESQGLNLKIAADSSSPRALITRLEDSKTDSVIYDKPYYHCSLTIFSPEMAVFLGYENRQLINYLTDWFDCRDPWEYETQHSGSNFVSAVWVNLIGGTTPSLLSDTMVMSAIGGGLTSRIIFACADKKRKIVLFPWLSKENQELRQKLEHDLILMNAMAGQFKIDETFMTFWAEWYPYNEANPPINDRRFDGYHQRRAKHLLKVSMIMSAMQTNDMIITAEHGKRALTLLEETEPNMHLAFSSAGLNDAANLIDLLTSDLKNEGSLRMSIISTRYYRDADQDKIKRALATLYAMKSITIQRVEGANDQLITWIGVTNGQNS